MRKPYANPYVIGVFLGLVPLFTFYAMGRSPLMAWLVFLSLGAGLGALFSAFIPYLATGCGRVQDRGRRGMLMFQVRNLGFLR